MARLRAELEASGGSRTTMSREEQEADSDLSTAAVPAIEDEQLPDGAGEQRFGPAKKEEKVHLDDHLEDATYEIACLRASVERRDAEVHRAQVEVAYLNTLVAQKDRELQQAESELSQAQKSLSGQEPAASTVDCLGARHLAEELLRAEAEAEQLLAPLAAAAASRPCQALDPNKDLAATQAAEDSETAVALGMASAAGGRLLASLRRAKQALQQTQACGLEPEDQDEGQMAFGLEDEW